ncbi:hypothetical protein WN944_011883 [Citrus x changshan-huyou]|uniref:Uncharacterized protein n=1 Tax=Citrus x changshan-huyou TaxID=2935761 RepID=A0AAP0MU86_9ROSI
MELKEMNEILSKNRVEDVSWLCSLSESELDMLISLKLLVLQRAKVIGHEELANKFDLKALRALGFILMERLKEKFKDLSLFPGSAEPAKFIAGCNLLKCDNEDILTVEELKTCLHIDSKRYNEVAKPNEEAALNQKKQKS